MQQQKTGSTHAASIVRLPHETDRDILSPLFGTRLWKAGREPVFLPFCVFLPGKNIPVHLLNIQSFLPLHILPSVPIRLKMPRELLKILAGTATMSEAAP